MCARMCVCTCMCEHVCVCKSTEVACVQSFFSTLLCGCVNIRESDSNWIDGSIDQVWLNFLLLTDWFRSQSHTEATFRLQSNRTESFLSFPQVLIFDWLPVSALANRIIDSVANRIFSSLNVWFRPIFLPCCQTAK